MGSNVCEYTMGRRAWICISHCHCSEFRLSFYWRSQPHFPVLPLHFCSGFLPCHHCWWVGLWPQAVVWLHTMKVAFGILQKAAGTVTFPVNLLWLLIPTACIGLSAFWTSFFFFFWHDRHNILVPTSCLSFHVAVCIHLIFDLLIYMQFSSEKNYI